jgi:hypothetical protein
VSLNLAFGGYRETKFQARSRRALPNPALSRGGVLDRRSRLAEGKNQQQSQQNPMQALGRAVDHIRRVQSTMELNAPAQEEVIDMLRQAGDLIWIEIERRQQQQQQRQQPS